MSSSQIPVFPINALSFAVDRAITNPSDVLSHLAAAEGKVTALPVGGFKEGVDTIYAFEPDANLGDSDIKLFKYSIGPIEISLAYNTKSSQLALEVYLTIPILGTVLVGSVTGSLTEGVSIKVGYGSILGGEVGIKLKGRDVILYYTFSAFGKKFNGEVKIFSI